MQIRETEESQVRIRNTVRNDSAPQYSYNLGTKKTAQRI